MSNKIKDPPSRDREPPPPRPPQNQTLFFLGELFPAAGEVKDVDKMAQHVLSHVVVAVTYQVLGLLMMTVGAVLSDEG